MEERFHEVVSRSLAELPLRDTYQLGPGVCTRDTACWGHSGPTGQDFSATLGASLTNRQRSGNVNCSSGRYVVVDHGGQVRSYSAHLDAFGPGIKAGATVRAGQLIGRAGNQGNSDGVHLHFEIRRKGAVLNPVSYLKAKGVKVRCGPQMQGTYSAVPAGGCEPPRHVWRLCTLRKGWSHDGEHEQVPG